MIPRILSVAGPMWGYATLAVLVWGLWRERNRFEWQALVPAIAGLAVSWLVLAPIHRLFFDEDIYISIAANLTHAPANQLTLYGGPGDIKASSYYKEPAGWPVLLSLIFLVTGRSESIAFRVARILFALTVVGVYQLTRQLSGTRVQAAAASIMFGAAPVCFWFSPSAGTDIPAAFMSIVGMWGLAAGNGALAAGGFAYAAQTRMELLALVPLVTFAKNISRKWKLLSLGLVIEEIVHIAWVMFFIAPVLTRVEKVPSAFGARYVVANLAPNLKYLLNPLIFPAAVSVLALVAVGLSFRKNAAQRKGAGLLALWAATLFCIYLLFYAGSFDINPRYSIQFLAPITILAALAIQRPVWLGAIVLTAVLPFTQRYEWTGYLQALESDHRISAQFASRLQPQNLIVSTEPEMFLNQNRRALNSFYARDHKDILEDEIRRNGKAWYHSGVRSNVQDSEEWQVDRWVKSNFELHPVESQEIRGFRIAFYEILLKHVDREARLHTAFESQRDGRN